MSCVLGTTERRVRWYQETSADGNENVKFVLHDVLDLDSVSSWGTKEAEKLAAQKMGLKTWRYVKI